MIDSPQSIKQLENGSVMFYDLNGRPQGRYVVRGGLSFPAMYPSGTGAKVEGYICLIAMDVKTRKCFLIEEMQFLSVEHVIDSNHILIQEGIAMFFSSAYTRYGCRKWYWNQDEDLAHGWRLKIYRCDQVQPQPQCIKVHWQDDRTALGTVWNAFKNGQLEGKRSEQTAADVTRVSAMPDFKIIPASVWALMCVINGLNQFPYRDREPEDGEMIR